MKEKIQGDSSAVRREVLDMQAQLVTATDKEEREREMRAVNEVVTSSLAVQCEIASDDDVAVIEPEQCGKVVEQQGKQADTQEKIASFPQCSVCKQSSQQGLHIVDIFMCATCYEEIVRTPVESVRYPHYVHKMREAWFSDNPL